MPVSRPTGDRDFKGASGQSRAFDPGEVHFLVVATTARFGEVTAVAGASNRPSRNEMASRRLQICLLAVSRAMKTSWPARYEPGSLPLALDLLGGVSSIATTCRGSMLVTE
jgi:hypothetical protein